MICTKTTGLRVWFKQSLFRASCLAHVHMFPQLKLADLTLGDEILVAMRRVWFAQRTVSPTFRDGTTLEFTIACLSRGAVIQSNEPRLRVDLALLAREEIIVALNARRLYCFRRANLPLIRGRIVSIFSDVKAWDTMALGRRPRPSQRVPAVMGFSRFQLQRLRIRQPPLHLRRIRPNIHMTAEGLELRIVQPPLPPHRPRRSRTGRPGRAHPAHPAFR